MARQNKLRDGVADLASKAFTPSHVRDNPLIFSGHSVKMNKDTLAGASGTTDQARAQPPEVTEQKGDLLIRYLWLNETDSVHNMRVMNTDAKSQMDKAPEKCLQEAERGKKRMYLEACLQQRGHFSSFVALVDGLLGL